MIHARLKKRLSTFQLDLELQAQPGVTVLYGASGAGKTLTLDCLAGFAAPEEGRILLDDRILFDAAAGVSLPPQQRQCGYVLQEHALFPHMTVRGNLLFAAERHKRLERHRKVNEMLERFRIAEFADRYPIELSGGQKQRCSIARALITEPRFLLLDEPARGLDFALRNDLYDLVRLILSEYRIPVLLVTHDLAECFALGDEVLILDSGRILQRGKPREVYDHPGSPEIARMMGIANVFEAEIMALDPGRGTSRIRMLGQDLTAAYFPGLLLGGRLRVSVPATQLRLHQCPGSNRVPARLTHTAELSDSVQLHFDPEIRVEVARQDIANRSHQEEWFVEFPQASLRRIG